MALLDNGAQINIILPKYVCDHSLQMGPITNLLGAKVTCVGLGNAYTRPLGYVVIQIQVDGVQSYGKEQRTDSPSNPRLIQFCSLDPCNFRNPHHQLSC